MDFESISKKKKKKKSIFISTGTLFLEVTGIIL